jgi:hypothetical protein
MIIIIIAIILLYLRSLHEASERLANKPSGEALLDVFNRGLCGCG